jgi:hypothetical protein
MATAASRRSLSEVPLHPYRRETHDAQRSDSEEVARVLDDRRQRALREVDEAPYGPFHRRLVIVAGTGFLAEAYVVLITTLYVVLEPELWF